MARPRLVRPHGEICFRAALARASFTADMALRRYTPSIARLQEEYSQLIARRVMQSKRPPRRADAPKIQDNSEPWNPDPRTVADLWEIAERVRERVERFQKWGQPPSNSSPE